MAADIRKRYVKFVGRMATGGPKDDQIIYVNPSAVAYAFADRDGTFLRLDSVGLVVRGQIDDVLAELNSV